MKDLLIILGMIIVAGIVGVCLYFYTPKDLAAPSHLVSAEATTSESAVLPSKNPEAVPFTVLTTGTHAAEVTARKNYEVGDKAGLAKLWKLAFGANATSTPVINFGQQEVVGIFAGEKPTGGYAIKVTKVEDSATERTIHVTLVVPGANCMTTQSVTSPYTIISLSPSLLPLTHQDATSTSDCK